MHVLENGRLANELSELKRHYEQQRASLEDKISDLEKQVSELTSDLSKVNSDLSDSSANYQLRVDTLETKLKSSNECLQVTNYCSAGTWSGGVMVRVLARDTEGSTPGRFAVS